MEKCLCFCLSVAEAHLPCRQVCQVSGPVAGSIPQGVIGQPCQSAHGLRREHLGSAASRLVYLQAWCAGPSGMLKFFFLVVYIWQVEICQKWTLYFLKWFDLW